MVNTREIAEEYRLTHWAQIMRERVESGLSVNAYCKQIGICGNTYFYWQRRVRAAACEVLPCESESQRRTAAVPNKVVVPSGPPRTEWVAICESVEPKNNARAIPVEIGNFRVLVDADMDSALLAKVCKVLMSLC